MEVDVVMVLVLSGYLWVHMVVVWVWVLSGCVWVWAGCCLGVGVVWVFVGLGRAALTGQQVVNF